MRVSSSSSRALLSSLILTQRLPTQQHAPIQASCSSSSSSSRRSSTSNMADEIDAARARMIAKRFGGAENVRTGGKGTVRRKRKAQHKNSSTADDKKLGATLKKLGVTNIPGIEEANMFKNNGEVIHFRNPKVQASIQAKTYVISGPAETKTIQELLPGIIQQLGGDNIQALSKQFSEQYGQGGAMDPALVEEGEEDEDDDDAVPDLVENFEAVST